VTRITADFPARHPVTSGRLAIFDARGRLVVSRPVPWPPGGSASFAWDGTDRLGLRVPAGVYSCTLELDGRTATTRIVVAR
jgi:flagellar hook assembly protein FlgD